MKANCPFLRRAPPIDPVDFDPGGARPVVILVALFGAEMNGWRASIFRLRFGVAKTDSCDDV